MAKRLDARYDWLPSPHDLIHKHSHFIVSYYGNACNLKPEWRVAKERLDDDKKQKKKTSEGRIALVSPGDCSLFTKVIMPSQAACREGVSFIYYWLYTTTCKISAI